MATGALAIAGCGTGDEAPDTPTSEGALPITGALDVTEQADTLSAVGALAPPPAFIVPPRLVYARAELRIVAAPPERRSAAARGTSLAGRATNCIPAGYPSR